MTSKLSRRSMLYQVAGLAGSLLPTGRIASAFASEARLAKLPGPAFGAAPHIYAITRARVVLASRPAIEEATLVIRDGLIEAVGREVAAPADARVIDGKGMTIYPGFIDAQSSLGIPAAPPPQPGTAAAPLSEMLAYRDVSYDLKADAEAFKGMRETGVTTVLAVYPTGVFKGASALINLGEGDGKSLVVRRQVAQHLGLEPVGGYGRYPSSLFGVLAFIRQAISDARQYDLEWQRYNKNPQGKKRPATDRAIEALQSVAEGSIPVVIPAHTEAEIARALKFAEELKLKIIISGATEAWKIASLLEAKKVPLVVSAKYPARDPENDPDEDISLLQRKLWDEAPANAANLRKAGVKFALSSEGLKDPKEFMKKVGQIVRAGLSHDDAVRALSLDAATILGVADRIGSIEKGKIANLVLATGSLFDEKTTIKSVFVDGIEYPVKQKPVEKKADQKEKTL